LGLGERCKLFSLVRGEAQAANAFWCILSSKIATFLVIYLSLKLCIFKHVLKPQGGLLRKSCISAEGGTSFRLN